MHQLGRQLARKHCHFTPPVFGRPVVLDNVEQLTRSTTHGGLMPRGELMVVEEFVHERHSRQYAEHWMLCHRSHYLRGHCPIYLGRPFS